VEPEPYEAEAITDPRRDNRGSGSAIDDPW
jgi:hypothetical protein